MPIYKTTNSRPKTFKTTVGVNLGAAGGGAYDLLGFRNTGPNTLGVVASVGSPDFSSFTLPESGTYNVIFQVGTLANSQTLNQVMNRNGSSQMGDTAFAASFDGAALSNGAYIVCQQLQMACDMIAGDVLQFYASQNSAGAQAYQAGYCWIFIQKLY